VLYGIIVGAINVRSWFLPGLGSVKQIAIDSLEGIFNGSGHLLISIYFST
jgi:hypothetical protein